MFKIVPMDQPTDWPVTVEIPQPGGRTARASFTARFVLIDTEEIESLRNDDLEFLRRCWVGWGEDCCDEHGQPLVYSDSARDRLARIPYVRRAVVSAYFQFSQGLRVKN